MIKYSCLVGEPGGGPRIARTKAPPRLDCFKSFLVAAVEAQCDAKIKMTESEVRVQLDRAARMRYGGANVARPKACLGEDILGLRVFTIERDSLKSGFPGLTHEWSKILDRAVVPLHDQCTGEPKVGVCEIWVERERLFEQAAGRDYRLRAFFPSCAREETPESRGMPCLFLNTERGFGGKPPQKSGFRRHLAGSKMPKEESKMPKEAFFTAISRWRVVSRRALDASGFRQG